MLSGFVVLLLLPLVLLIRRSPESMGLLPDGEVGPGPSDSRPVSTGAAHADGDVRVAFTRYEGHRKPRTSRIQAISSASRWRSGATGAWFCSAMRAIR